MHFLLSVDKMEVYEKQCPLDMTPKTSKIQQELYVEAECMGLTSSQPRVRKPGHCLLLASVTNKGTALLWI